MIGRRSINAACALTSAGALVTALLPNAAKALQVSDGADENETEYQNADDYDLDLFTQPGPALLSLEVAPRRASAPSTPSDFDYDLGNISGPDGVQYGLAISASPYWIGDRRITLEEYRNETSKAERIFARSQISLGGSLIDVDGAHAWRLAAAVQTQLLDRQDHRYDRAAFECLHDAWSRLRRGAHESTVQELAKALSEDPTFSEGDLEKMQMQALEGAGDGGFEAARRTCQDESAARLIAKASWLVGGGVGLRSDQNRFADFDYDGVSVWTHYRQPLTPNGRYALFAMARGDWDRAFDIGFPAPVKADAYEIGGGAAWQTTRYRLDLSAAHNRREFRGTVGDDDFIRYAAVADIRLRPGLWLEGSIGLIDGSRFSDGAFGGGALKFDWSDFRRGF